MLQKEISEISGLHINCKNAFLVCDHDIQLCSSLKHSSIDGLECDEVLSSILSKAIQNSRLSSLNQVSLTRRIYTENGTPTSLFFESAWSSVNRLNLYNCILTETDQNFWRL